MPAPPVTPDQPSDRVRAAWVTWAPISDPDPDLDAELEAALLQPGPTWDAFFHEEAETLIRTWQTSPMRGSAW